MKTYEEVDQRAEELLAEAIEKLHLEHEAHGYPRDHCSVSWAFSQVATKLLDVEKAFLKDFEVLPKERQEKHYKILKDFVGR